MIKIAGGRGFTLIELLVVIAIIGMLASIVLVSLSSARDRAKDARITADLSQVRAIAELINDTDGAYSGLCSNGVLTTTGRDDDYDDQLATIQGDITTQQGETLSLICNSSSDAYCVQADLVTGTNKYCIDSTGYAGGTANCDATGYDCS
jgi:prepilin-type N-terminal cleavage/methylation domain-containing protein